MDDRRKLEIAGWALGALVVGLIGLRLVHGGGAHAAPVSVAGPGTPSASPAGAAGSAPAKKALVVDVEGEVARPGITRVPAGSRAEAAVAQAGGLTRRGDATAVNLAAPLHDGQQIVVPRRGAGGAAAAMPATGGAAGASAGAAGAPSAPISLSSATVAQLDSLDGIGPTLAQRIVAYRDAHGGFRSIEELKQVEGIGDKRFASLRKALQP